MPLGVNLKVTVHKPLEIIDGSHEALINTIEKTIIDEVNRLQNNT